MTVDSGSIFFYISGHGFGHASRQIEIINALAAAAPAPRIVIRSSAAPWLFERTLRAPCTLLPGECDTGVVQIDSLRLDEEATIRRAADFHHDLAERAGVEAALLRRHEARLVIADAPPLACAAAAAAGVPSIVLSNFTWDWIYQGYPEHLRAAPDLVPIIQSAYRAAAAAWRLPLGGGFAAFDAIVDLPFVARHARHTRDESRAALGLPAGRPLALSSFGGYGVRDLDLAALDCLDHHEVVIAGRHRPEAMPRGVHFVDERRIYDSGLRYEDLVAAVDVVVTKPGYGIISECVANKTAMLYTSRGRFVEYGVMVEALPRLLRCGYIPREDLLAGRWRAGLEHVLAQPDPPEHPPTNGAQEAARRIREALAT